MKTVTLMSALVVVAVVLLSAPQSAEAACCPRVHRDKCGDCTRPTPYCGYGRCNIVGCSCIGGCRSGSCERGKRDTAEVPAESILSTGDLNGDGILTLLEAEVLINQNGSPADRRSIRSLDANDDGMLTAEEIDF